MRHWPTFASVCVVYLWNCLKFGFCTPPPPPPPSKLQSELRTTNLEELKITVETYFEEVKPVPLHFFLGKFKKTSQNFQKLSTCRESLVPTCVLLAAKPDAIIMFTLGAECTLSCRKVSFTWVCVSRPSDPEAEDASGSYREEVRLCLSPSDCSGHNSGWMCHLSFFLKTLSLSASCPQQSSGE